MSQLSQCLKGMQHPRVLPVQLLAQSFLHAEGSHPTAVSWVSYHLLLDLVCKSLAEHGPTEVTAAQINHIGFRVRMDSL